MVVTKKIHPCTLSCELRLSSGLCSKDQIVACLGGLDSGRQHHYYTILASALQARFETLHATSKPLCAWHAASGGQQENTLTACGVGRAEADRRSRTALWQPQRSELRTFCKVYRRGSDPGEALQ